MTAVTLRTGAPQPDSMAGILIVDDDPTIRSMFARALKALGDIEQAANGADALRLLGAKKYSIVLLDLHMPVIDGFVILHTLASKPGPNRETPIYVIAADTSDQARIRALRRHAVFLLTKPVPIGTLTALVESTLKKAAARAGAASQLAAEGDADDVLELVKEGEPEPVPRARPALDAGRMTPPFRPDAGRMTPPFRPVFPAGPKKPGS
jgi:CheY-like chemotaxis protein